MLHLLPLLPYKKMKLNGLERYELEKKNFLDEACMAVLWSFQGFKGRTFHSSGFSTGETLVSAFTVSQQGEGGRREKEDRGDEERGSQVKNYSRAGEGVTNHVLSVPFSAIHHSRVTNCVGVTNFVGRTSTLTRFVGVTNCVSSPPSPPTHTQTFFF